MSDTALQDDLAALVQRRDDMHSRLQVLRGQLGSARKRVQEVEAEVRERNIEPDKLAETIDLLEAKGREEIEAIQQELEQADERLKPFLNQED